MPCDDGGGSKETSRKAVDLEDDDLNPAKLRKTNPNYATQVHTHQDSLLAVCRQRQDLSYFKVCFIYYTNRDITTLYFGLDQY